MRTYIALALLACTGYVYHEPDILLTTYCYITGAELSPKFKFTMSDEYYITVFGMKR